MANEFYEARKRARLFSFSHVSPSTQNYLCKVYLCLFASIFIAMSACAIQVVILNSIILPGGFLLLGIPIIAMIVGLVAFLVMVLVNRRRHNIRLSMWLLFSYCQGLGISGFLYFFRHDYWLIIGAFLTTCIIFLCLSGCALLTKRRTFLFLGTFLLFALIGTSIFALILWMFPSKTGTLVYLIITLVIFMLMVLYETQLIIEMSENGYRDQLLNSASLLVDFMAIFIRILALMGSGRERR